MTVEYMSKSQTLCNVSAPQLECSKLCTVVMIMLKKSDDY